MKNLTVTVDDQTYTHARVVAARRGTSLSRLVRDYLANIDQNPPGQEAEWQSLWQMIDQETVEVGDPPTRARTYADARIS